MPQESTLTSKLEDFAIAYGTTLAAWSVRGTDADFVPLDAHQVAVSAIAAIATHAKTLPEYDPSADITDVVKMATYAYGKAAEANFLAETQRLQERPEDAEPVPVEEVVGAAGEATGS